MSIHSGTIHVDKSRPPCCIFTGWSCALVWARFELVHGTI